MNLHNILPEKQTLKADADTADPQENLLETPQLSHTGSFGWSPATGMLYWSPETFRIFKLDETVQPTLKWLLRRTHPDDRTAVRKIIVRASRDRQPFDLEHRLLMPDGAIKFVRVVGHPLVKTQSGTFEYVGAVTDITQRIQAAEALRAFQHLAHGQLQAMKQAMAALSHEAEPEKFLAHVLCITAEQINAHSISVWEMNASTKYVDLIAISEDGQLRFPMQQKGFSESCGRLDIGEHPLWRQFFETGEHCIYGVIATKPTRVRIAIDPNGPWHDRQGSQASVIIEDLVKAGISATLSVPMFVAGKVTGMLNIRFQEKRTFRPEEIELTRAMAHQAMLSIQMMRLSRQSREAAVLAERNRLTRDIHDTLAQGFTGVIVQLEAAADARSRGLLDRLDAHLGRATELARHSLREARRSIKALRPQSLKDHDLCEALKECIQIMTTGSTLHATFIVQGQPRAMPEQWEEHLLHISQEALTNVIRHAQAGSFDAKLIFDRGSIHLELRDDGRGFDTKARYEGLGLIGIRERVKAMHGKLQVASEIENGTAITLTLSLPDAGLSCGV